MHEADQPRAANPTPPLAVRVWRHLRSGTLLVRLNLHWIEHMRPRREARWPALASRKQVVEISLQHGVRLRLHTDSELSRLLWQGGFELGERQFLNRFLRAGDTFADVGANIGMFTAIAARLVGETGRVLAFEPCATTFARLEENIALTGSSAISAFPLALSDNDGDAQLTTAAEGYDAWHSLAAPAAHSGDGGSETVKTQRLDRFAEEHALAGAITAMKIDVEGWEAHVLAGGRELLSRPDAPLLLVEFTDDAAVAAGTTCQALYAKLEELGYTMFLYDLHRQQLTPEPMREHYGYCNIVACKDPAPVLARLAARPSAGWCR
jgi:FkbM family methyltransferase